MIHPRSAAPRADKLAAFGWGAAEAFLFFIVPGVLIGWLFALAAVPIRLPRFVLIAFTFAVVGWLLRRKLSPRALPVLYGGGWGLFYLWFFLSHPG